MALKTFNPTSPGRRQLVQVDRSGLWKGKPVKTLTEGLSKSGGRNNAGRLTSPNRGGGHKRSYRLVDFKRRKFKVGRRAPQRANLTDVSFKVQQGIVLSVAALCH